MAYFKGGDRGGSRGGDRGGFRPSGGRPSFGAGRGGDDRPKEMHDAVCSSCGKDCQVPFRPSGGKPVFCRDCFAKEGGGRELGRQAGFRGNGRDRDFSDAPMPARSAPINPATTSAINNAGAVNSDVKKQLEQVNVKLERLISAVEALTIVTQSVKTAAKPVTVTKSEEKAPVKKAVKKSKAK